MRQVVAYEAAEYFIPLPLVRSGMSCQIPEELERHPSASLALRGSRAVLNEVDQPLRRIEQCIS